MEYEVDKHELYELGMKAADALEGIGLVKEASDRRKLAEEMLDVRNKLEKLTES